MGNYLIYYFFGPYIMGDSGSSSWSWDNLKDKWQFWALLIVFILVIFAVVYYTCYAKKDGGFGKAHELSI
jgi:hypothetical protein